MSILVLSLSGQALPTGSSTLFVGSGSCATCHSPGDPNPGAMLNGQGQDVSPTTWWRSGMMANAARDPLWQAKVQAEILAHPELQSLIEDKCSTCHAPMGRTEARFQGREGYTISEMLIDPLAMDGVSCAACHQIQDQNLGEGDSFSGHYTITDERLIYGPHENPISGPMVNMINYRPEFSSHASESEMCATCHTLFTPYVDDDGQVAGEAPEQVPYLEWLNSTYPEQGIECQTCHMPAIEENIELANRPPWLNPRNPLHQHEFVGGNVFMLKLVKEFGTELGVTASVANFDSTISKTLDLLHNHTTELELRAEWNDAEDTLEIAVKVQNLSGHKFPTAYPSRRAWLELRVDDLSGETVFHSGGWTTDGEVIGLDSIYEPHHQVIQTGDQVQIYQNIPADINGDKTYTLLRIADYLKDNRIPPIGYLSHGVAADSTMTVGLASLDLDFNVDDAEEGSGSDIVQYRLGDLSSAPGYRVTAIMNYQTIAPRFAQDLFEYDNPEVTEFQSYYDQMDLSPIILDSAQLVLNASNLNPQTPEQVFLVDHFPNPFNPITHFRFSVPDQGLATIKIFNLQGQLVNVMSSSAGSKSLLEMSWDARDLQGENLDAGVYIADIEFRNANSDEVLHHGVKLVYLK
mgnify:CR=1 FL=1